MNMAHADDERSGLEVCRGITEDVGDVFADAARSLPATDTAERAYINCLLDRVTRRDLEIYVLAAGRRAVGAICCRALDGDVDLVFGHLVAGAGDLERYFLGAVVRGLLDGGAHTVRSNFSWPKPGGFVDAARALGFTMTERMGMGRSPDPVGMRAYDGFEIMPWRDDYASETCRLICENQAPADRAVYPALGVPEGVKALMESVMNDRHGRFLRELSFVARADGRLAGLLISTLLADGSVLILDLGVDRNYRRRGIGGTLLDRLIGDAYALGYGQIVLAVTSGNNDAIRLYERKGFMVNGYFRQHVLSKIR